MRRALGLIVLAGAAAAFAGAGDDDDDDDDDDAGADDDDDDDDDEEGRAGVVGLALARTSLLGPVYFFAAAGFSGVVIGNPVKGSRRALGSTVLYVISFFACDDDDDDDDSELAVVVVVVDDDDDDSGAEVDVSDFSVSVVSSVLSASSSTFLEK